LLPCGPPLTSEESNESLTDRSEEKEEAREDVKEDEIEADSEGEEAETVTATHPVVDQPDDWYFKEDDHKK
jgi:hypothetical protein